MEILKFIINVVGIIFCVCIMLIPVGFAIGYSRKDEPEDKPDTIEIRIKIEHDTDSDDSR